MTPSEQASALFAELANLANIESNEQNPNSFTLQTLIPTLDIVFAHLNHMKIGLSDSNSNSESEAHFHVLVVEEDKQEFQKRIFHTPNTKTEAATFEVRDSVTLPVFSMRIQIGKSFNIVNDLPDLVAAVENAHNSKMREYGSNNPMEYIDTSKELQRYWEYRAEKLNEFIEQNKQKISSIQTTAKNDTDKNELIEQNGLLLALESYQQLALKIAAGFSKADSKVQNDWPQIDTTPYLEIE